MKAVGYQKSLPITDDKSLVDVDCRSRAHRPRPAGEGAGRLREPGRYQDAHARRAAGRRVARAGLGRRRRCGGRWAGREALQGRRRRFYAGTLNRQGTNQEFHLVDERIVGPKPKVAVECGSRRAPLTAITAWEMLFDRLDVKKPVPGAQERHPRYRRRGRCRLYRHTIRAGADGPHRDRHRFAPRDDAWVKQLGAHHVVDHSKPLAAEVASLGIGRPGFRVLHDRDRQAFRSDRGADRAARPLRPDRRSRRLRHPQDQAQERLGALGVHVHALDVRDRRCPGAEQATDRGRAPRRRRQIKTTLGETFGRINATNLRRAHALIESGKAKGKIVLEGF